MPLRDLLKKKDKIQEDGTVRAIFDQEQDQDRLPQATEFKFIRSDTNTQSIIQPPTFAGDEDPVPVIPQQYQQSQHFQQLQQSQQSQQPAEDAPKKRFSLLRGLSQTSSSPPSTNPPAASASTEPPAAGKEHRKLSERLHLGGHHRKTSSINLPSNLPEIKEPYDDASSAGHNHPVVPADDEEEDERERQARQRKQQVKEARWEERATLLASTQPQPDQYDQKRKKSPSPNPSQTGSRLASSRSGSRARSVSDAASDANIQEAIRLHEDGQLEAATAMFYQLAERGNVLSQVLYGLSLRHGWGCEVDLPLAVKYLSSAAQNSAAIESEALKAGITKGGAAKGELVLAIFELGNCFRYGWGVSVDKVAARQYYETAANLGDTDAMNEAAWCYLEGFGGKKDKFKAAQLLRLAEKNGSKTLGNTWIWKEKYDAK